MTDPDSPAQIVPVEILGQRYPVRSTLDAGYVAALAAYVDEKMRAVADVGPTGDPARLAVLAALNIADEFFRCCEREHHRTKELTERTAAVEEMIDRALGRLAPADTDGT